MSRLCVGDRVRLNGTAPEKYRGQEGHVTAAYGDNVVVWNGLTLALPFRRSEIDLIERIETQKTQLPPASVAPLALPLDEPVSVPADPDVEPQPYDMPSPGSSKVVLLAYADADAAQAAREEDALDRIADLWGETIDDTSCLREIAKILHETGRLGSAFGS